MSGIRLGINLSLMVTGREISGRPDPGKAQNQAQDEVFSQPENLFAPR